MLVRSAGLVAFAALLAAQLAPIRPLAAQPRIEAITPAQGPIGVATTVTITGAGFSGATIRIDGQPVTATAHSDASITLNMRPHDNGYVVISVSAADGTTAYARYLYVPPRLSEIPPGYITTVAGVGNFKGDFGPALEAAMRPLNLAFDSQGHLYVAEPDSYEVSRIRTDGMIERYAGTGDIPTGGPGCCGDGGPAWLAPIGFPRGLAVDATDGLFVADKENHRIRRVDTRTGVITTVAGTGVRGFSGDGGLATAAQIGSPTYVVSAGSNVYFIDFDANRIRRIDRLGTISTFAGNGLRGFFGDGGPATQASFDLTDNPDDSGLAAGPDGSIYLIDNGNHRIRKIDTRSGVISTLFEVPRPASRSPFAMPTVSSVAVDREGNIYYGGSMIVKLSPGGLPIRSWGVQPSDLSPDGTPLERMHFGNVTGMTFDIAGHLVYSDQSGGRVRRMNFASGFVETLGGVSPSMPGEEGLAVAATLRLNNGSVALTRTGDLLIADERVRRVNSAGIITTLAGRALHTGAQSNQDNVPALTFYNGALALHVGPNDEVDTASFLSVPYHIGSEGMARILVGRSNDCGYTGDGGPATAAQLCQPWDITRDRAGNVFIADTNNNRIRRVDAVTGIITTFAGSGPVNGFENYRGNGSFCGDGGPAIDACFNTPYSVAFDPDGNLFVSDFNNRRIRRIDGRTGIVSTFAQTQSTRGGVSTIRFDQNGFLYTHYGDRIVRYDRNGQMTVLAGTAGRMGFSGDGGPALQATINVGYGQSAGLAVDDQGNVFFVDPANRRVRAIRAERR